MRDRGRIKAPSSDPIENLRTRLSEQDRQIQDLYRRLPASTSASTPAAADACCSEAFRLDLPFASRSTFTTGPSSDDYQFSLPPSSVYEFATADISVSYGGTHDGVVVPAGLWMFVAAINVKVNTDPSAGRFSPSLQNFDLDEAWIGGDTVVDYPHAIFDVTHGFATTFGHLAYFPAGGIVQFSYVNNLNVAGSSWGSLSGTRLCAPCGTVDVGGD